MSDDRGPQADLCAILDLHGFRVFTLDVDIFTDKHTLADLNAAPAVQQYAQSTSTRRHSTNKMQEAIPKSPPDGFLVRVTPGSSHRFPLGPVVQRLDVVTRES
jgi:hypothetical protein